MSKEELMQLAAALKGLCVLGCLPGSPSDLAGLRYGDVVLEVNGVLTDDWAAFMKAVSGQRDTMSVRYFRDGEEHFVELVLPQKSDRPDVNPDALLKNVAARVLSRLHQDAMDDEKPLPPLLN
ncbi:MAG: PDZ domain-containing protein [Archangium sp.]